MDEDIDLLLPAQHRGADSSNDQQPTTPPAPQPDRLVIEATRQITLRCGKSSITLYPDGKIALRGDYILSDAEAVNRIVGGQIELN